MRKTSVYVEAEIVGVRALIEDFFQKRGHSIAYELDDHPDIVVLAPTAYGVTLNDWTQYSDNGEVPEDPHDDDPPLDDGDGQELLDRPWTFEEIAHITSGSVHDDEPDPIETLRVKAAELRLRVVQVEGYEDVEIWKRSGRQAIKEDAFESVADQLEMLSKPADIEVVLDPFEKEQVLDFKLYWQSSLDQLLIDPEALRDINPRQFEELVAELLEKQGHKVQLTQKTRDGGRDILAWANTPLGNHLYLVECKRFSKNRPVGVAICRSLFGVVEHDKATAGIVATTSHFSADAWKFQKSVQHRLTLKGFDDMISWIRQCKEYHSIA